MKSSLMKFISMATTVTIAQSNSDDSLKLLQMKVDSVQREGEVEAARREGEAIAGPKIITGRFKKNAAEKKCIGLGRVLCSKGDISGISECTAGWLNDGNGYYMDKTQQGCGSIGFNSWEQKPSGAWCCLNTIGSNWALGKIPSVSSDIHTNTGKGKQYLTDGKTQTDGSTTYVDKNGQTQGDVGGGSNFFHSGDGGKQWVKIPLDVTLSVQTVKVWNRCDNHGSIAARLTGFQVFAGETLCGTIEPTQSCTPAVIDCGGAVATGVRVEKEDGCANIVEIEVFGTQLPVCPVSESKRCSNYKIKGKWTRTTLGWKEDVTLEECAVACRSAGECNLLSYGVEAGKNICHFNAPVDCKEERWAGYSTYRPARAKLVSESKRCSNYRIKGEWTRTTLGWTDDISLEECAVACSSAGECNLFSYGVEEGKNICHFNAPVECKEERWAGYSTYSPLSCS